MTTRVMEELKKNKVDVATETVGDTFVGIAVSDAGVQTQGTGTLPPGYSKDVMTAEGWTDEDMEAMFKFVDEQGNLDKAAPDPYMKDTTSGLITSVNNDKPIVALY